MPPAPGAAVADVPSWFVPPGDFCQYCCFKPWPADQFEKTKKLADAIHGKVYLYKFLPEDKVCVVKKMENNRVLLLSQGLLEDARVEIGVSTFLMKQRSDLLPDAVENIVEMRDVFQDNTHTYFVTELAENGELFNHVKNRGNFPEADAKAYAKQLFRAAASLHRNGVVHRDISLENVLLTGDNTVRFVDFGQAVPVYDDAGQVAKYTGRASKQYYRAPEMYEPNYEGRPVDVFAMGVLIFIMIIGTPPWDLAQPADQRWRYIKQHGIGGIIKAWRLQHLVSAPLMDLLTKLLASNPADRPTMDQALAHEWFQDQ
jgi:serine/threonine protein kinase